MTCKKKKETTYSTKKTKTPTATTTTTTTTCRNGRNPFLYGLLIYLLTSSLYVIIYKQENIQLILLFHSDTTTDSSSFPLSTTATYSSKSSSSIISFPAPPQKEEEDPTTVLQQQQVSDPAIPPVVTAEAGTTITTKPLVATTKTTIAKHNYKLYKCGYGRPRLRKYLFPEIFTTSQNNTSDSELVIGYKRNLPIHLQPTSKDIMLFGMHGKCDGTLNNKITSNYVENHFPGKALFVNGEPFGNIIIDYMNDTNSNNNNHNNDDNNIPTLKHIYQAGAPISCNIGDNSEAHHPHMICLYHIAVILVTMIPTYQREWILNSTLKPKNDGTHNAIMYMASNCVDFRQNAAKQLSQYVNIHFGGSCTIKPLKKNGTTIVVSSDTETEKADVSTTNTETKNMRHVTGRRDKRYENYKIFSKYKYCLVMENSYVSGYISEKILFGYLGGCVPIYYGTKEVLDVFNPKSFIYYDIHNPQIALKQIQYLQNNHSAYYHMLHNEPILKDGNNTINQYFSLADNVGDGSLKRKIRIMLGLPP